ncbi:hypothetical protein BpHYR1_035411 [Brachionus plicatilis]|uniref:Uncharacterized protein n=1 Tax=Brachionus plicatilis TaxID=10195 RepID=A0A3M7R1X0_BRAPC|nr:hypothetical protein BpHYR1_035411 [Brachionus plicatilis]
MALNFIPSSISKLVSCKFKRKTDQKLVSIIFFGEVHKDLYFDQHKKAYLPVNIDLFFSFLKNIDQRSIVYLESDQPREKDLSNIKKYSMLETAITMSKNFDSIIKHMDDRDFFDYSLFLSIDNTNLIEHENVVEIAFCYEELKACTRLLTTFFANENNDQTERYLLNFFLFINLTPICLLKLFYTTKYLCPVVHLIENIDNNKQIEHILQTKFQIKYAQQFLHYIHTENTAFFLIPKTNKFHPTIDILRAPFFQEIIERNIGTFMTKSLIEIKNLETKNQDEEQDFEELNTAENEEDLIELEPENNLIQRNNPNVMSNMINLFDNDPRISSTPSKI